MKIIYFIIFLLYSVITGIIVLIGFFPMVVMSIFIWAFTAIETDKTMDWVGNAIEQPKRFLRNKLNL